jgi:hypothetical protein
MALEAVFGRVGVWLVPSSPLGGGRRRGPRGTVARGRGQQGTSHHAVGAG